jgi:hypothetical protein
LAALSTAGDIAIYPLATLYIIIVVVLANNATCVDRTDEQLSNSVIDAGLSRHGRKEGKASTSSGGAEMKWPSSSSDATAAAAAAVASGFVPGSSSPQ